MKLPMKWVQVFFLIAVMSTWLASAARATDMGASSNNSLYQRLGGEPVLIKIAGRLIDMTAQDPHTSRTFQQKVNVPRLKKLLAEQFIALTGGPQKYSGEDMRVSHAGLGITEAEFYGMVEHLRTVLDSENIGQRERNEFIALLAPMKRDIVEKGVVPASTPMIASKP